MLVVVLDLDFLANPLRQAAGARLLVASALEELPAVTPELLVAARTALPAEPLPLLLKRWPAFGGGLILVEPPLSLLVLERGFWRRASLGTLGEEVRAHLRRARAVEEIGFSDTIELGGRSLRVQTEVTRVPRSGEVMVRTTVFDGGAVSDARTVAYPPEARADIEAGRSFVQHQHRGVLEAIVARTRSATTAEYPTLDSGDFA